MMREVELLRFRNKRSRARRHTSLLFCGKYAVLSTRGHTMSAARASNPLMSSFRQGGTEPADFLCDTGRVQRVV